MDQTQKMHYLKQTTYTDPHEYSYLYDVIPNSIKDICNIVNKQLIHPAKLASYPTLTPNDKEIWNNEPKTTYEILKKLVVKNTNSIIKKRTPEDRVIITCRGFTLLLLSILRYKGIPARARAGFAPYIMNNGINIDHWICECWDDTRNQWILMDADFCKIDFSKEEFKYAADVCLDAFNGKINSLNYGCFEFWGMTYIITYLNLDLLCILQDEPWYNPQTRLTKSLIWEPKSELSNCIKNLNNDDIALIKRTAELLLEPDKNYNALKELLAHNHLLLQIN